MRLFSHPENAAARAAVIGCSDGGWRGGYDTLYLERTTAAVPFVMLCESQNRVDLWIDFLSDPQRVFNRTGYN